MMMFPHLAIAVRLTSYGSGANMTPLHAAVVSILASSSQYEEEQTPLSKLLITVSTGRYTLHCCGLPT
jgi:uncharacterized membrane protein